ncbi:Heme oxygenase [Phytophthora cinnamomi]|uniref:Heme oxygenase n=1 Tax=Phytophthora cinnamomi TaxID=4785 RepID=UPI003559AB99|nr:Heme oxygenase [Phytophthora cinnamomi]
MQQQQQEQQQSVRAAASRERAPQPGTDGDDAPRIPHLLPSRAMFASERAADGLLGLLASHADKQLPLLDQRELLRRRQQTFANPRPVMSLEAAASAMHPAAMLQRSEALRQEQERPRAGSFIEDRAPLAAPLVSFLARSNKCGSPRLPDNVTSPRSVWEESPPNERLDPTASPRHTTAATSRLVPTPPTTSSWRIHNLLSPDPTVNIQTENSRKRRASPSSPPQEQADVAGSATKRPRLVRRASSQWRQELSPRDRAKTRERIMRSLHMHCQGDYEMLLLLLSSMDEELLHIKTTSSEFYAQQAFELSDLIEHATLEH